MQDLVHCVLTSRDKKTGPIPVTYSTKRTCPDSCQLKKGPCYAEFGNVKRVWNKISAAVEETTRYLSWERMCSWVESLPAKTGWRMNVAGDLPHTGDSRSIDAAKLAALVTANRGKRGFTYTHHDPHVAGNAEAIKAANANGFAINLSADGLREADDLMDLGIAPVVTIMPQTDYGKCRTSKGRKVVECLATNPRRKISNCLECQFLCARADRGFIVGFPPHGTAKRAATEIMLQN